MLIWYQSKSSLSYSFTQISGLSRTAVVADALREGCWWLSNTRSRNPIIYLLKDCLPPPPMVNLHDEADDERFLWKVGDNSASDVFSTAKTWEHYILQVLRWIGLNQFRLKTEI